MIETSIDNEIKVVINEEQLRMIKRHAIKKFAEKQGLDLNKNYGVTNLEAHVETPMWPDGAKRNKVIFCGFRREA